VALLVILKQHEEINFNLVGFTNFTISNQKYFRENYTRPLIFVRLSINLLMATYCSVLWCLRILLIRVHETELELLNGSLIFRQKLSEVFCVWSEQFVNWENWFKIQI